MFLKLKIKINKLIYFALVLFLISYGNSFAANLNFLPEGGNYRVGDIISVRVIVSSPNESVNAVSARVNFSQANLSLVSVSKSGSVISLWAQEPTFSNAAGTASFEGIVLSGYSGSGATIVTLNFRAKSEGVSSLNFISASVLANDGLGTNLLKGMNEASFNIGPAPTVEETTKNIDQSPKTPKEIIKEAVTPKIEEADQVNAPIIYYQIREIDYSSIILICAWVLIIFALLYLYLRYRYKVDNGIEEAKKIAKKSFQILKEDIKNKNTESLESDIYDAEKVIMENIDDIEKI